MKKLSATVASLLVALNLSAFDELTGDTKLACEAILCLSTSTRPSECVPSIRKFFSIKAKKPWETIALRRNFLNLCPTDNADIKDPVFAELKNEVLVHMDTDCSPEYLNTRLDKRGYHEHYGEHGRSRFVIEEIRIKPDLPRYCQLLMQHQYTDVNLKNVCGGKYYRFEDWQRGYELQRISYEVYKNLPPNQRESKTEMVGERSRIVTRYFKKIPINKKCWIG